MISSVLKAIEVLEAFSPEEPFLSLAELSEKLGYPKSTIHTILKTLESKRYIEKSQTGVYSLGLAVIPMTQAVRVNVELRDRAAPFLRELGNFCGESIYLAIKDGDTILYIYAIESSNRLLARTAVGERTQMHFTSVGKAILAFLPSEEVEAIVDRQGMPKTTEYSISSKEMLFKDLERIRENGYSVDDAEHEKDTYCLGAPIFDHTGKVIGACSISGNDKEILGTNRDRFSAGLRFTAQSISRQMGFMPKGDTFIWKDISNPLLEGRIN